MGIITLLTDFGLKDGNVGVMKGVIWGIAPQTQIADLSHLIAPQNIAEAALILYRSVPYFPERTVHIVVVDPGVGTARRPIAASMGNQFFVGPDNGVITLWLNHIENQGKEVRLVHLNHSQFWLPEVSHVFHGRDIFAPCGAFLAAGTPLEKLGTPIYDPVRLQLPIPERTPDGWTGQVIHIDHFGNIASNLRIEHFTGTRIHSIKLLNATITGLVKTFGERPPGDLIALFGSTGNLIIAVVNGNAAKKLDANIGDPVLVRINK